jgi:hypothetical protein
VEVSIREVAVRLLGSRPADPTSKERTMTTTTTTMTTARIAAVSTGSRTRSKGAGIGIGLALAGNLAVFLLGNLGTPIRVVTGWEPGGADLRFGDVAMATIVWVAIGAVALWALGRLRVGGGFHLWSYAVAAFTAVSMVPLFSLEVDAGSKVALGVMHVVVGAAAIVGQRLADRSRPTS